MKKVSAEKEVAKVLRTLNWIFQQDAPPTPLPLIAALYLYITN